jgi:hypothetical protein
MSESLMEIKLRMVEEHSKTGAVDIERWIDENPDLPREAVEFAATLNWMGPDDEEDLPVAADIWVDHGNAARNARRGGIQEMLRTAGHDPDLLLGSELARARREARPLPPEISVATPAFRRAVVYTWAADVLLRVRGEATRFATQKIAYLLERALELDLFVRHRRMAAGPYDWELRYVDAEPIAITEKRWLERDAGDLGFTYGPNIGVALGYAPRYIGDVTVAEYFAIRLSSCSDDELETWATVDSCAVELVNAGQQVSVGAVKNVIHAEPKWQLKLRKAHFSDQAIQEAIGHLISLGLLARENVVLSGP